MTVPSSAYLDRMLLSERELAITGFTERFRAAMIAKNVSEARWLERCLGELQNMTDQEFEERYRDIEE